jgi:hypothetical protein|tara:strand:- start:396 stop:611 length:216 start_codon:yes stop_codon:yes gene_type:complete
MSIKKQRFEKVAEKRVNNIIHYLELLSNCSNTYNYEYSKEDVDKIFRAIIKKVNYSKSLFADSLNKSKFKL